MVRVIPTLEPLTSSIGLIPISAIPTLLKDTFDVIGGWGDRGESGRIDPFVEIYEVNPILEVYTHTIWVDIPPFSSFSS